MLPVIKLCGILVGVFLAAKFYIDFAARNGLDAHGFYGYAETPWYYDDNFNFGWAGPNADRTLQLKLDFLGEAEYQATIYTDAKDVAQNANRLNKVVRKVTKEDTIELPLAVDGGSVVQITKL